MDLRRPFTLYRSLALAAALACGIAMPAAGWAAPGETPSASLSASLPSLRSGFGDRAPKSAGDLRALEARFRRVVAAVSPAVVAVSSGASGVVVSEDGLVVCVAHVGERSGRRITFTFPDGRTARGVTLGNCSDLDAALMRITDPGPWPHVDMGRSSAVRAGQWCLAMSYPTRFEHGKAPVVRAGRVLRSAYSFICTDCAIMGGDSGGPLFDLDGKVIGVSSTCDDSLLQNRHVPIDRYRDDWDRLAKGEDYRHSGPLAMTALLGLQPDQAATDSRIGVVTPLSPANAAGLKAGDVIRRFDGRRVRTFDDVNRLAARHHPGCTCDIVIVARRGDQDITVHTSFAAAGGGEPDAVVTQGNERNGSAAGSALRGIAAKGVAATVRILVGGKPVAQGLVVDPDGYIVTKASLLHGDPICRLHDGRELPAKVIGEDLPNDLAVLRVEAKRLPSARWRKGAPPPAGSVVVAPGADGAAVLGVVSTDPRKAPGSILPPRGGWLGISLDEGDGGVVALSVMPDSPADAAGLHSGDRIDAVDGRAMRSPDEVQGAIRHGAPGDTIRLTVFRDNRQLVLNATLRRQPGRPGNAPEDAWGGGPFSDRRWGFPSVLPHDIAVRPEDCGGPLLDSDGAVAGVNIARALRVSTFALSAETVQDTVRTLMAHANQPAGNSAP